MCAYLAATEFTYGAQGYAYIGLGALNIIGIKLIYYFFQGGIKDWLGHVKAGPKFCLISGILLQIPLIVYFFVM